MKLSLRLGTSARSGSTPSDVDKRFAFVATYSNTIDEISIFTDYWHHGYTAPDQFAAMARRFGEEVERFHAAGFSSVGINLLDSIGHVDEAWDFLPELPFQRMVGHDGSISRSCACPNAPDFRTYLASRYRTISEAKPDFIWVDDDVRMNHHGVAFGCFCTTCLSRFQDGGWSREGLVAALNDEQRGDLRLAWIQNNEETLVSVCHDIVRTIHDVNPSIKMGFMTTGWSWTGYNGIRGNALIEALGAIKVRPGGGFYDDASPRGMVAKAIDVARQCRVIPATALGDVQYELENFPYQTLDKSVRTVLNECALSLIAGCNGIALNALKDLPGSDEPYRPLMDAIAAERPLWSRLVESAADTTLTGLLLPDKPEWSAIRPLDGANWFGGTGDYNTNQLAILSEIGIPITVDPAGAIGTALMGKTAELYSDDALRELFTGGVILDSATLRILERRGLAHLAGVTVGKGYDNGVYERLTDHALNGAYAADARDTRISFWPAPADTLVPMSSEVGILARLIGYNLADLGACATAYVNDLGGRAVTLGYAPWTRISSACKRTQMLSIVDWISGSKNPVTISKTLRISPWVRFSSDHRRAVILLLNTSYDDYGAFDIVLRGGPMTAASAIGPGGLQPLTAVRTNAELIVTVPELRCWRYAALVCDTD